MKNLDKKKSGFSDGEKFAIEYLEKHGFDVTILQRFATVDHMIVKRDGVSLKFDLQLGKEEINYEKVMRKFANDFARYSRTMKEKAGYYQYEYQLLDRMRTDCEYFLGAGNGQAKYLWAGNVGDHIRKMRDLYSILPVEPEWMKMKDIDLLHQRMLSF